MEQKKCMEVCEKHIGEPEMLIAKIYSVIPCSTTGMRKRTLKESRQHNRQQNRTIFCIIEMWQERTVRETIRICKDRNVLKEYLMNREMEVVTIMMSLFNDEQIMKTYWKDMENTLTDKITHDKDREIAERLIKKGKMSLEDIADCVPALSFDELKEIETDVMQLA